jgi:antitoxin (DNA-binding transcriptional repressor) of toxin-antitoxin stability system
MTNISPQEMASDPAALLDRVEAGERVLVVRGGRAVAELRPIPQPQSSLRPFGLAAGAFSVPDDFDAPLPDSFRLGGGDQTQPRQTLPSSSTGHLSAATEIRPQHHSSVDRIFSAYPVHLLENR